MSVPVCACASVCVCVCGYGRRFVAPWKVREVCLCVWGGSVYVCVWLCVSMCMSIRMCVCVLVYAGVYWCVCAWVYVRLARDWYRCGYGYGYKTGALGMSIRRIDWVRL